MRTTTSQLKEMQNEIEQTARRYRNALNVDLATIQVQGLSKLLIKNHMLQYDQKLLQHKLKIERDQQANQAEFAHLISLIRQDIEKQINRRV